MGGWNFVFYFNWIIIIGTAIFGFGFGGYASVKVGMPAGSQLAVPACIQMCLPLQPLCMTHIGLRLTCDVHTGCRPLWIQLTALECLLHALTAS